MAEKQVIPIATRGQLGLGFFEGPPSYAECNIMKRDGSKTCRVMTYSTDGTFFAYCNSNCVRVVNLERKEVMHELDEGGTYELAFSPRATYLAIWKQYITYGDGQLGKPNFKIYETSTGKIVKEFIHKRRNDWKPQWSEDEKLLARSLGTEVHFFEDGNFDTVARRLHVQKFAGYEMTLTRPTYVCAFVPMAKSAPAFVRIFRYPNLEIQSAIACKSFYKADKINMQWNAKGNALLVLAETDADKTNSSYYGEGHLHLLTVKGTSCMIQLAEKKRGPIYSVEWHPDSEHFIAVFGFVPVQATLFNLKGDALFDFGETYKNTVHFSPFGSLLVFSGFGNMRGKVESWDIRDVKQPRLISIWPMPDTTGLQWLPDGEHLLSATTSPRLRVGNGLKVWHYSGALLYQTTYHPPDQPGDNTCELWEVAPRPYPPGTLPAPEVKYTKVQGIAGAQGDKDKAAVGQATAYVPPHLRGSGAATTKGPVRHTQRSLQGVAAASQPRPAAQDAEKRIKNLKKKLDQIQKIKERKNSGQALELNQVEKLKTEDALRKELEELGI